jgi:hypothetical protein
VTLWTPGGEHPVPRRGEPAPDTVPPPRDLSPDEQAQLEEMREQMEQVREELLRSPAAVVVANHAMGIYELAAIHLMAPDPKLVEAAVAIDGLAALVEALAGRLGPEEATLREALAQLRAAYLEVRARTGDTAPPSA